MKCNQFSLLIALLAVSLCWSQDYKRMIDEGTYSVAEIQTAAESYFDQVGTGRGTGYKPYKRWEYRALRNMDANGMLKSPEYYFNELESYNSYLNENFGELRTTVGNWEELGPVNWNATSGWNPGVGRITSIAVETANPQHIIVGAHRGGVWRSIDGGGTWTVLTDNLSNLSVYALTMDPQVNSTYYWGSTSGTIFKSVDSGATWNVLADLGNGNVNKILINPNNPSNMYCTVAGGGIFRSFDGGTNWSLIHNAATTGYDVEFKPGDPNVVYASGTDFFKSIDGGLTFSSETGIESWSQEFQSGTTLWTTSGSNQNQTVTPRTGNKMGLFYIGNFSHPTTNLITPALNLSGATNPILNFSFTSVNWDGDIDELRVLYKTSSGGPWIEMASYTSESVTWNDVSLVLPNATADYYIAFQGTSNYGRGLTLDDISVIDSTLGVVFENGFEVASNAFSGGPKMIGVSIDNPDVVYVIEALGGVFEGFHSSNDSGSTFTKLDHQNKNYFGYADLADDDLGQAPRDMDIAVNPADVNDVHIAGINTWRSTDGGANFSITSQWTPFNANFLNIGYCHADVDILEYVNDKLYVGTDGGIFVAETPTTVDASYYTDLTAGLGIRQFYKIGVSQTDPVVITGGSQDNGSSTFNIAGNWIDWIGADGMEGFVDKNNPDVLYGTSQFGSLYKSFNAGASLSYLASPDGKSGNWVTPFEQDPIQPDVLYAAYDEVYRSDDAGASWGSISQNFGANLYQMKVAPNNSNVIYASLGSSLYKTIDGGISNWISLTGFSGVINSIAVHPTNFNKIAIATTGTQKVYVSENGGISWVSYKLNLPGFNAQALTWYDNGLDGLYLGMNYGVYYIDDTYSEWQPFSNGLPNVEISELEINYADNKLYASTFGRGLWRSNLFDPNLSVADLDLDSLRLMPNPASSEVTLSWGENNAIAIRIYNAMGKLVHYEQETRLPGSATIDVSGFASGLYFVRVSNNVGQVTKKLLIE